MNRCITSSNARTENTSTVGVLFGLGRLNLALSGEVLHEAGVRLVGVNPRSMDVVAALQRAGCYRILVPGLGGNAEMIAKTIPLEECHHYDSRMAGIESPAVKRAAAAQIVVSGLAKSDTLFYQLTARFFVDVLTHRVRSGITSPVDMCCNENPVECQNASDLLQDHLRRVFWRDDAMRDHLLRYVRFPRLLPDRICSKRQVASPHGMLEVVAESHRELIVGGASWYLGDALSATRGCVLVGDELAELQRRKLYLFCLAHALAGYSGIWRGYTTTSEAMRDLRIKRLVNSALESTVSALAALEQTAPHALRQYATQVVHRISTAVPGDSILRVVRDPSRKLLRDDRLVGPALLVLRHGVAEPHAIVRGIAMAMHFCLRYFDDFRRGCLLGVPGEEIDDSALQIGEALFSAQATPAPLVATVCGLSPVDPVENRLIYMIVDAYCSLSGRGFPIGASSLGRAGSCRLHGYRSPDHHQHIKFAIRPALSGSGLRKH